MAHTSATKDTASEAPSQWGACGRPGVLSSQGPAWLTFLTADVTIGKVRRGKSGLRDIAYKIVVEKCITAPWLCGDCRPGCPNQAISSAHVVDPDRCTECIGAYPSPHCADVCPVGACVPDPQHPETREQLLRKWRSLHPGEEPASGAY